jgi:hypothetical protein
MMREVLPSAKVILVWPRGVAPVGVEARLEPSEVMTSLGSTVARVVGRGPVIAPPRPRVGPPDVIVVPEPEAPPEAPSEPEVGQEVPGGAGPVVPPQDVEEEATDVAEDGEEAGPDTVVSEPLPHVLMRPVDISTPTWTYTAPGADATGNRRRRTTVIVLAIVAALLAIALGATVLNTDRTVSTTIVAGSVGDYALPGSEGPGPDVITDEPGTYEGVVHVRADGSIRLRASGDIRLRLDGLAHVIASGDVKVSGEGVVNNVSSAVVRVRGNGTIRITVRDGTIRLRLQGTVTTQGDGVVRVGGIGRFLIIHRPA